MGITVPGDDAGEYVPPGGVQFPEHLTPDNLALLGHLFGTPLTPLHIFAQLAERGEEPDEETATNARTSKREIVRITDFLLSRYGTDIDSIDGLREFLMEFRKEIADFQWSRAVEAFRAASDRFHF